MRGAWILALSLVVLTTCVGQVPPAFSPVAGDDVFQAMVKAYPHWVTVRSEGTDAILTVDGHDFVWAEGRILPPDQASQWASFAPQSFYDYPREVPDVASWSEAQVAQAEERLAERRSQTPRRESKFFDTLWGVFNRRTADEAQKRITFLGLRVTVHQSLAGPLARIEGRLATARASDPDLDRFLKGIAKLDGYNWRDIAETQSRSNHAYGAAIDLIPRSYRGKNPYWLWAPQEKPGWYRTAWARRWEPHPAVVKAFEAEGFVWGGKWLLYDTIHFEYRPEILVLAGLR